MYNASQTLRRCVDSILNQIYKDFEIILVNDGSLDESLQICNSYEKEYGNIVVINKVNGGASSARNEGLKKAKGEYICFIDSDDEIPNNYLSSMINAYNDNVDLVMCPIKITGFQKRNVEFLNYGDIDLYKDLEFWRQPNFYGLMYSPCNKLYIRKNITEDFPLDVTIGEDAIFNMKYIKNCKVIRLINDVYYNYYFENPQSLTKKFSTKRFDDSLKVAENLSELFKNFNIGDEHIENRFILSSLCSVVKTLSKEKSYSYKEKKSIMMSMINHEVIRKALRKSNAIGIRQKIAFLLIKLKFKNILYFCSKLV